MLKFLILTKHLKTLSPGENIAPLVRLLLFPFCISETESGNEGDNLAAE